MRRYGLHDALRNPLALRLTGGQVHDITQAEALTAEAQPEALLGDKGYDADAFIESLEVRAIKPVIPPKSNRPLAIATSPSTPNATSSSVLSIPQTVPSHLDPLRKNRAQLPAGACMWSAPWLGVYSRLRALMRVVSLGIGARTRAGSAGGSRAATLKARASVSRASRPFADSAGPEFEHEPRSG